MQVFVVMKYDYGGNEALAVFSSKEKAQNFINTRQDKPDLDILEFTLDTPKWIY